MHARPGERDTSDRIAEPWGSRTPYGPGETWPRRVDTFLDKGTPEQVDRWAHSACVLCSNGCGLDIAVAGGRIVGVRGRADDRVNHGRLGPKGLFGWQANHAADRLTRPLVREDGELVETDWDTAMGRVVQRSRHQLDTLGPGSIGFYTSGQLFCEEYYTLGVIGKAGLGTPHMDGNTRLCTATAAQALKETFGTDGQPASYSDVDHADTILHWGHNVAETQTVLWMRILDRRRGVDPPRLVVVDPRPTPAAREADLHLAVQPGTNLALLNGLVRELLEQDWIDRAFIDAHTVGFDELAQTVRSYDPERVAGICGVPAGQIREAARIVGTAERLLSTVLQGVYQSMGATAAACQVNNLNLVRGMIGRPGCGILQMNGQPTAQNTRETGANGDLPGFRNWDNEAHVRELAELWNVDPIVIPHWAPPTHAMQIWRYAEQGSIGLLWISATNPAVSLPELHRIRSILASEELFVVVQDAFLTETAGYADVVLPTAIWGEKTGTLTNTDRTVHLSERAVDPPGEARSDLDIFLDYAARMEFRDRDGQPLVRWHDAESAFEAWKACSRGRPCDYSGMSYERLREAGAIQWPATTSTPTAPSASTPTCASTPTRTSARTTATTCSPGRSPPRPSTGPATRPAGRSSRPPTTSRRTSCHPRTIRCCSPPAGPCTTPHPHQDRPRPPAAAGRARPLGGAVGGRRRAKRNRRRRPGPGRIGPRPDPGAGPYHRHHPGDDLRPLPLRLFRHHRGCAERAPAGRQRADHHRMGSGQ